MKSLARSASAIMGLIATACGQIPADRQAALDAQYAVIRARYSDVDEITVTDLRTLDADRVVVVDVREPREREVSQLPGAISVDEFEALPAHEQTARQVVAYCTIGERSGKFARTLGGRGIRAANLEGGILAWTHAGLPLENAAGPTDSVHVYGRAWNLAAEGYRAVW